jgi:type IV pilus assembly protein PilN
MINLLPWREELRQKRKKEFAMLALSAVLLAGACTFGTKVYYKSQISSQEARNTILRSEIAELDKQIAEINALDAQKRRLLDRMEIIEQLERTTPEAVMLVDSLVNILPEGSYLASINQQATRINLTGHAQSNQRVSDLMRNVESSEWLKNADLDIINTEGTGPQKTAQFNLQVEQVRISDREEALQ